MAVAAVLLANRKGGAPAARFFLSAAPLKAACCAALHGLANLLVRVHPGSPRPRKQAQQSYARRRSEPQGGHVCIKDPSLFLDPHKMHRPRKEQ